MSSWFPRVPALLAGVALMVLVPRAAAGQSEVDVAMTFFSEGGAYCFRLAPEGTNLSEETSWTVMMLTAGANAKNKYRIRSMDPGTSKVRGQALKDVGLTVVGVWRRDRLRDEFFERFAAGIANRSLRARIVTLTPPRLAAMKPMERADAYLKFADRGTEVDFSTAADLTPDEFQAYRAYSPD